MSEHRVCPEHGREERGLNDCREVPTMGLRDAVNALVDILGCTRQQACSIIVKARREGYRVAN